MRPEILCAALKALLLKEEQRGGWEEDKEQSSSRVEAKAKIQAFRSVLRTSKGIC